MTDQPTSSPQAISIRSAAVLSGLSLRTWQRRIQDGQVAHLGGTGVGTLVPLQAAADPLPGVWDAHDVQALLAADGGDALAQAEVGAKCAHMVLRPALATTDDALAEAAQRMAWHFLTEAAQQEQADAMHWLGLLHAAQAEKVGGGGRTTIQGAWRSVSSSWPSCGLPAQRQRAMRLRSGKSRGCYQGAGVDRRACVLLRPFEVCTVSGE